jgi:hypothetical protein
MLMLHSRELNSDFGSLIRFPEQEDPEEEDPERQGLEQQDEQQDVEQQNSDPEGPEQEELVDEEDSATSNLGAAPEVVLTSGAAPEVVLTSGVGCATSTDSMTSGAAPASDPLSECDDWPKWFIDGIGYLQGVSTAKAWTTFLASFVRLERNLGFTGTVSKHHDFDLLRKAD